MKRFACGDIVPGCAATWQAADEETLLRDIADHAAAEHGMPALAPPVVTAVREHIHEIA